MPIKPPKLSSCIHSSPTKGGAQLLNHSLSFVWRPVTISDGQVAGSQCSHGVSASLVNHWSMLSSAHWPVYELFDGRICILFIFCVQGLENVWLMVCIFKFDE